MQLLEIPARDTVGLKRERLARGVGGERARKAAPE